MNRSIVMVAMVIMLAMEAITGAAAPISVTKIAAPRSTLCGVYGAGGITSFRGNPSNTGVMPGPGPQGTPKIRWSFPTDAPISSSVAVTKRFVYVGSDDGRVYGINRTDPTRFWSFPTDGRIGATPAVDGNLVYVVSNHGLVAALDAETGNPIWQKRIPRDSNDDSRSSLSSSPVVVNGAVYFGGQDGKVYALNAMNGEDIWRHQTKNDGRIISTPAVSDGVVYIGAIGGVYALDVTDGHEIWNVSIEYSEEQVLIDDFLSIDRDLAVLSSPAIHNGTLFVGGPDGSIYWINLSTHTVVSKSRTLGQIYSSPAVGAGRVVIGSTDGVLYGLDEKNSALRWSFALDGEQPFVSSPTIAGETVFISGWDGVVRALNATDGAELWNLPLTSDTLYASPAVADGAIYIGGMDGVLYAIEGSSLTPLKRRPVDGDVPEADDLFYPGGTVGVILPNTVLRNAPNFSVRNSGIVPPWAAKGKPEILPIAWENKDEWALRQLTVIQTEADKEGNLWLRVSDPRAVARLTTEKATESTQGAQVKPRWDGTGWVPASAVSPTSVMGSKIQWGFIFAQEELRLVGVQPNSDSGVTIATGVDVGHYSKEQVEMFCVSSTLRSSLLPYLAFGHGQYRVGADAKKLIDEKNLIVDKDSADTIDFAWRMHYIDTFAPIYDKATRGDDFANLPWQAQTALIDFAYHGGNGWPYAKIRIKDGKKVRSEDRVELWNYYTSQQWEKAAYKLLELCEGDAFQTRREREAVLIWDALKSGALPKASQPVVWKPQPCEKKK